MKTGEPLTESLLLEDASFEVDVEGGIVRGVTLIKPRSKKGHTYNESFMRGNASRYDGIPVLSPHLAEQQKLKPGMGDVAGRTTNSRFDESRGGVVADVEAAPNDLGKTFLWAAGRKWKSIGISHEAAKWAASADGKVIESWEPVRVAVVFDPATTTALDESEGSDKGGTDMDLAKLKAEHPALVESIRQEVLAAEKAGGERAKLEADLKQLRESKADLEKKLGLLETEKALGAKRAQAATLLESSQVLAKVRADKELKAKHLAVLEGCADEAGMKAYLETLEKTVAASGGTTFSESKGPEGEITDADRREVLGAATGR